MIKWIKELRSTEKGKTLFKFILYMMFFLFVLVLCISVGTAGAPKVNRASSSSNNSTRNENAEEEPVNKELTYFEKQGLFSTKDYDFEARVTRGDDKISFIGECLDGRIEGFKEDGTSLIHYVIENGIAYKLSFGDREEIDDLYEGIEERFFQFESLFEILNSSSANVLKDGNKKTYSYTVDGISYKVVTDEKAIRNIEIESAEFKYEFSFKF